MLNLKNKQTYTYEEFRAKLPYSKFLRDWSIDTTPSTLGHCDPIVNAQYEFPLNLILQNISDVSQPKNIIFNDPATIVYWQDGTKTEVKTMDGDTFNEEYGVAMAYMKKIFGSSTGFKKIVAKYKPKNK
jgi:hypothetical protein